MSFTLPELPYAYDALEPFIDAQTMKIHHSAHHQAYVNNLNAALAKHPENEGKDLNELLKNLDKLPADIQTAVRNNGGGHYNHDFFWKVLAPAGSTSISSALEAALVKNFGSVDAFKEEFEKYAWSNIMQSEKSGQQRSNLYAEGIDKMSTNPHLPQLFRDIFRGAYVPYRDPETLNMFLKMSRLATPVILCAVT